MYDVTKRERKKKSGFLLRGTVTQTTDRPREQRAGIAGHFYGTEGRASGRGLGEGTLEARLMMIFKTISHGNMAPRRIPVRYALQTRALGPIEVATHWQPEVQGEAELLMPCDGS